MLMERKVAPEEKWTWIRRLVLSVGHIFVPKKDSSIARECYTALHDIATEGMIITDKSVIVSVNDTMVQMLGYQDGSEIIGRDVNEFTTLAMRGRFENIYRLNSSGPYVIELVRKDGQVFLVEAHGRNIFRFGHSYRVTTIRDLSDGKRGVEPETFAQTEDRMWRIFNSSPSLMAITSISNGVHIDVNDAWVKMFGVERSYAVGRSASDLGIWHSLDVRDRFVSELRSKGFVKDFVTQFNVAGGGVSDLAISAEPIMVDQTECMILSGYDVSDRLRAEKATQLYRKESEKVKGLQSVFLSHVSHELRNPLNTIVGYADGLSRDIWGRMENEKQAACVRAIKKSSDVLVSMVNDLLDLASLESGQMRLNMEPCDLPALVLEWVKETEAAFEKSGVELNLNINKHVSPCLLDKTRLQQAVEKVLLNARRYTPKGGEVSVHLYENHEQLILVVEDNGLGMPEKEAENAFRPFMPAYVPDEDQFPGARMAMPLAKQLVEAQNGRIDMKSIFGEGTRVVIMLPIFEPSASLLD